MSMFNLHIVSRLIEEKKLPTAISLLNEITKKVPAYVTPYVMLAKIYETVGNKQGALVSWRSAQRLVPSSRVIKKGIRRNQPIALPPIIEVTEMPNEGSALLRDVVAVPLLDDLEGDYTEDLLFEDIAVAPKSELKSDLVVDQDSDEVIEEEEVNLDEMVDEFFEEMKDSTDTIQGSLDTSGFVFESDPIPSDVDAEILAVESSNADESAELDKLIEELQDVSSRDMIVEDVESEGSIEDFLDADSELDIKELELSQNVDSEEIETGPQDSSQDGLSLDDLLGDDAGEVEQYNISGMQAFPSPLPTDLDQIILEDDSLIKPESDAKDPEKSSDELLRQDDVVSETLARIYISQKKYIEAARVYKILSDQYPERSGAFKERAKELRVMAAELED